MAHHTPDTLLDQPLRGRRGLPGIEGILLDAELDPPSESGALVAHGYLGRPAHALRDGSRVARRRHNEAEPHRWDVSRLDGKERHEEER